MRYFRKYPPTTKRPKIQTFINSWLFKFFFSFFFIMTVYTSLFKKKKKKKLLFIIKIKTWKMTPRKHHVSCGVFSTRICHYLQCSLQIIGAGKLYRWVPITCEFGAVIVCTDFPASSGQSCHAYRQTWVIGRCRDPTHSCKRVSLYRQTPFKCTDNTRYFTCLRSLIRWFSWKNRWIMVLYWLFFLYSLRLI